MFLKYTSVTQCIHMVLDLFLLLLYVPAIQHLNYSGQESKQLAVYDFDMPVTLKKGHKICNELVDLSKVITMQSLKNLA